MINDKIRLELEEAHQDIINNKCHKDHYKVLCYELPDLKLSGIDTNLVISIYAEDFSIHPHFHIEDIYGNEYACICIDIPEYYDHNDGYNNRLNNQQIDELVDFINKSKMIKFVDKDVIISNWEAIISGYQLENDSYLDYRYEYGLISKPDYSILKGDKIKYGI